MTAGASAGGASLKNSNGRSIPGTATWLVAMLNSVFCQDVFKLQFRRRGSFNNSTVNVAPPRMPANGTDKATVTVVCARPRPSRRRRDAGEARGRAMHGDAAEHTDGRLRHRHRNGGVHERRRACRVGEHQQSGVLDKAQGHRQRDVRAEHHGELASIGVADAIAAGQVSTMPQECGEHGGRRRDELSRNGTLQQRCIHWPHGPQTTASPRPMQVAPRSQVSCCGVPAAPCCKWATPAVSDRRRRKRAGDPRPRGAAAGDSQRGDVLWGRAEEPSASAPWTRSATSPPRMPGP